jgi:mono/diheme cytochrome c family protein
MKMSKMLNIKSVKPLILMAFFLVFLGSKTYAIDGESVFKANCAACHKVGKDLVGPALKGTQARWEENSSIENLYKWVKNSQGLIDEGDVYAKKLYAKWGSIMPPQAVSNEEIDAIFEYVEGYTTPLPPTGGPDVGVDTTEPIEESTSWLWYVIAGLLIVVIIAMSAVKNTLRKVANESDENLEKVGAFGSIRAYLWRNFNYSFFFGFVIVISVLVMGYRGCSREIGVFDGYKPDQPIAFSHKIHAGQLEVECVYCHNSAEKSKHAGIPTTNVCMNCHKAVAGETETGTEEIAKIYEAAGFDASTLKYSGQTKPVDWVKVHNLPDHVYFNHSQHVVVGGLDCKQCHGDMTKETVGKVMSIEELNAIEDNEIKFTRPTLTMGWCIECHGQKEIDIQSDGVSDYYKEIHDRLKGDKKTYTKYLEDDKITVAELGGWECAKCHY